MWKASPDQPVLSHDEVHVWRASLEVDAGGQSLAWNVLTDDERARAERFRLERDRRRFIAARGMLRGILGCCLRCDPRELRFHLGPHGKPVLAVPGGTGVGFNLSHSDGLMLCAVSVGRELGVDIERIQPALEVEALLEHFSPREVAALRALPAGVRHQGFYACWTTKEAYVKARGGGLSIPLSGFTILTQPNEPPVLLEADHPQELSRWALCRLEVAEGFAAALAVEGHGWHLRCLDWSDAFWTA